jgi:hypothetical protein
MAALLLIQLFSLSFAQAPAESVVVMEGRPVARVESTEHDARHSAVPAAERETLKVVIVRKGNRYFWASRVNRELERRVSGAFHYFIDRIEGGYIRVFDRSTLPESMRPEGAQFEYTEHVPVWRSTMTYWGVTDRLDD